MAVNSELPSGERRPLRLLALLLIGAGLLILGIVAALLWWRPGTPARSDQTGAAIPAEVGFPAPDLELQDLGGQPVSLKRYLGGYVLVNNWATWCPPCRAEMPALQAFYQDHRDEGFYLVAIDAGDPPEQVSDFVELYGLTFPVWLDSHGQATLAFRNQALPSSYLIDPAGRVVLAWNGAVQRENLERFITPLLEQQTSN